MPGGVVVAGIIIGIPALLYLFQNKTPKAAPIPAGLTSFTAPPQPEPVATATAPPVPPSSAPPAPPPVTIVRQYNQLQPDCTWWQITIYSDGVYGIKLMPLDQYAAVNITPETMIAYMKAGGWAQADIDRCLAVAFPGTAPPSSDEWRGLWPWGVVVNNDMQLVSLQMQFEHRGPGGAFVLGVAVYDKLGGGLITHQERWYKINADADWQLYGPFELGTVTLDQWLIGCISFDLFASIFDGYRNQWLAQQWAKGAFQLCGGVAAI